MKQKKNLAKWLLLSVAMVAAVGCSDNGEANPVQPQGEEWTMMLSRSTTNNENVLVSLEYSSTTKYGELIPAYDEGETASWVEGKGIIWPSEETGTITMKAFSPVPASEGMPAEVSAEANTAYLVAYETTVSGTDKIQSFTLRHIMGLLQVHIMMSDESKRHLTPQNAVIRLHPKGSVDYPNHRLLIPDASQRTEVSLGTFAQEGESTSTKENWKNEAQIIVPQTLPQGEVCLSFTTEDGVTYTFTPEKDITLVPGKENHLYLGIAMNQPGTFMALDAVTVTDWIETEINAGEAEE